MISFFRVPPQPHCFWSFLSKSLRSSGLVIPDMRVTTLPPLPDFSRRRSIRPFFEGMEVIDWDMEVVGALFWGRLMEERSRESKGLLFNGDGSLFTDIFSLFFM